MQALGALVRPLLPGPAMLRDVVGPVDKIQDKPHSSRLKLPGRAYHDIALLLRSIVVRFEP